MQKTLKHIINNIKHELISGSVNTKISGISFDSRKTKKGHLFVAVKGVNADGHSFIKNAIKSGASAIMLEHDTEIDKTITVIKVKNSNENLGIAASNFYNNPSAKLKLIGVTGTNGKTTTATLLYKLFLKSGYKVGLISTVKDYINEKEIKTRYTTPDVITFNRLLNEMVSANCEYCFTEVSSHAIHQNRIGGLTFAGGIFTNITHDHLDYHKTFKEYIKVKKTFFDNLPENAFALTNIDDKNGNIILQNTKAEKYTYALRTFADFKTKVIEKHIDGMLLETDNTEVWTLLTGTFNAYNLTAVYATALLLGLEKSEVLTTLSTLKAVEGRFEIVINNDITAIIDYAHTPDALQNVIQTINELRKNGQILITVVGAGGNRDKEKRPLMAKAALNGSDKLILTSDNPRNEVPERIIEDMATGVKDNQMDVLKITERREAIKTAIILAKKGDIILIAGKGHENYQEINDKKIHFDDKETAEEFLKSKK
ncbi:MAG: UDP-N-acetylmuramoyl-L-alanyl-D-glutamate--2,6-diaminopimelate ligase [Bacteroidales bacterium]|nr:UDP-N-acetylmuramoyl-L-alanyl-D-glutamate--2,6-diaminopimelate ligase [Bacteroidales bacterium]